MKANRHWVVLGMLCLVGCVGSSPPQDHFYRLSEITTTTQFKTRLPGVLLVSNIEARGFSGDRNLVFWESSKPRRSQQYHYHYWEESPITFLQDRLIQSLRAAGVADQIVSPNQRLLADYLLGGDLLRLEQRRYPNRSEVLLEIELSLVHASSRKVILLQHYRIEEMLEDASIEAALKGFERAFERLVMGYLKDLEQSYRPLAVPIPATSHPLSLDESHQDDRQSNPPP